MGISVYPKSDNLICSFFEELISGIDCHMDNDTVLLIVNNNTAEIFQKEYYSFYGKKVIAYALELNYLTIPMIKIADFIFYQDARQKALAEHILGFEIPCASLPTIGAIINSKSSNEYKSVNFETPDKSDIFNTRSNNYEDMLNSLLVMPLAHQGGLDNTFEIFRHSFLNAFMQIDNFPKNKAAIDNICDLNIFPSSRKTLQNKFVFSICFRNQQEKIGRCIESICLLKSIDDFGVVVVDDASIDKSVEIAEQVLAKNKIEYVIVRNKERKYAAKNFYNVIHSIVINDDTFIIELDGDDFIKPHCNIFNVLNPAIMQGAQKTIGNFCVFNGRKFKSSVFKKEKIATNFKYPRNLSKCSTWYHLRMTKRRILRAIEIEHFLESNGTTWLKANHDISVHSRAVELAKDSIVVIDEELYVYDISGNFHGINGTMDRDAIIEEWSYGTYLLDEPYLSKLYIPLFEEPQKIMTENNTLVHNPFYE